MKRLFVLVAALTACSAAQAIGIGVRAGTTGIGLDVAKNIAPLVDARIGYSAGKVSHHSSTSGASYDGDIKLSNLNALLDFHPLGPLFRITGGVIYNKNKYEATGTSNSTPGSFNATVESGRKLAPYLGVGFGNVAGLGLNFYADLGLMFMGSPKATLNANCTGLSGAQCSALQGQAAAEQSRLQDDLKSFKAYPVLNLGITFGF